jgi:hypothetical protein
MTTRIEALSRAITGFTIRSPWRLGLCSGAAISDGQIDDNDRKQQELIHKNTFSCRRSS